MENKSCNFITINEDAGIIADISTTTQAVLDKDNHITISNADAIPTIVYQFLKTTIEELNKMKKTGFAAIFEIIVNSFRRNRAVFIFQIFYKT